MAYEDRERTPIGRAINDVADRVTIVANKAGIALDVLVRARPASDMAKYAGEMAEFQRDKAVWRGAAPERIEPGLSAAPAQKAAEHAAVRPTLTGDWNNSLSGMIESRVSLGESSAGHHYAVSVMQRQRDGLVEMNTSADGTMNAGWSKPMATADAAWKAGVAIADRAIAEPKSAAQTTAFQKSFDAYVATLPQPSQSQRDSARTAATAQAPASVAQRQPMVPVARASLS